MDPIYYFVLAVLVATSGISFVARNALRQAADHPDEFKSIQTKLFIGVAAVEAIPIVFVVLGFIGLENRQVSGGIATPLMIVLLITLLNVGHVLKTFAEVQNKKDQPSKQQLQQLLMVSIPLLISFPLIAIVAAFTTLS